jgi:hypothetical protein
VELEVQEDLEAERMEFVDDARTMPGEELQAELHPLQFSDERPGERQCFFFGFYVEGEDESARRSHADFYANPRGSPPA